MVETEAAKMVQDILAECLCEQFSIFQCFAPYYLRFGRTELLAASTLASSREFRLIGVKCHAGYELRPIEGKSGNMANVLKGNFAPAKQVAVEKTDETNEDKFEREAKKRLGGSIAFVSKKKVVWEIEE